MLNIIENFPILFDSKEKVKELRNLILTLAVRGKLVPQDPKDEPASVLLKRIEEEKKRLVKEKKIKRTKSLPPIGEDEVPFELPLTWEWVRLGEVCHNHGQKIPCEKFTYIDVGSINKEKGELTGALNELLPEEAPSRARKIVMPGTIIYSTVRPYLLNIAIIDREFQYEPIVSTAFAVIHTIKGVYNRYLFYYLRGNEFNRFVESQMVGMAYPAINDANLFKGLVPLPPLSEQYRIVQKIDELMALCDELEKALEKKAQSKELASKSISNLIQKSGNQEQLKANLTLLINMFKEVYSTKANIKHLRDTILQLAIQGKLVPRDPKDEPASVLLKQIEEEKKRLVKEKKIKKAIPLPPISEDERPFELPNGWGYVRLGNIGYFENGDRSSEYPKENELVNNGIPFINTKNMFDGYINLNENQLNFITKEKFQALRSGKLVNGDFLFVLRGSVGKNAVFRSNHLYNTGFINAQLLIVRSHLSIINEYLRYFFKSNLYNSQIVQMSSGSAQPQLAASNLKMMVIPLPPILEQQRIVQKVDELMALCDKLEKHIEATVHHSDNLMKSIIKTAI